MIIFRACMALAIYFRKRPEYPSSPRFHGQLPTHASCFRQILGGHPKAAINRHLKTGHFLTPVDRDVDRDEGLRAPQSLWETSWIRAHSSKSSRWADSDGRCGALSERPGVRRETASDYLKAAGIPVRGRGRPGEEKGKPAISAEVSTDSPPSPWPPPPTRAPQASACEPLSGSHRRGAQARAQCDGDLAGPGRRGLHRPVRQCPALRPAVARRDAGRGARGDHDGGRARNPRSTTGTDRWSAIRRPGSFAARVCSS